jgi:hypothetical protein
VGEHVGVDVAEGSARPVDVAVGERLKDPMLEVGSRVGGGDGGEGFCGQVVAANSEASVSTPAVTSASSGSKNSGTPGVVCSAMLSHTVRAVT